jgi:hypothetical protein
MRLKSDDVIWVGLSSGTKPVSAYPGQVAIETDTGQAYIWYGDKDNGSWSSSPGYDRATNAQISIEYDHHEIHDGRSYFVDAYDADLDTSDVLIIAFKTPNTTRWLHVVAGADNTVAALFEVLEAPTITNGTGSDSTIYNSDRNSSNVSGVFNIEAAPTAGKASINPTITANGTVLKQRVLGSGAPANKVGGQTRGTQEIILKPNTIYAFRLTGLADNGAANVELGWYELINAN